MRKAVCLLLLAVVLLGIGPKLPSGWKKVGKVSGLNGEDWYEKRSANTVSIAREGELAYVDEVVKGLEASFQVNRAYMGFAPPKLPLVFFFFPMAEPAHTQPMFAARLRNSSRAMGVALGGTEVCVINTGDQRQGQPYAPWEVQETARHEMNHLFAFQLKGTDRLNSWGWLYEALAECIENTVKPPSTRMNVASLRQFLKGYRAVDANWTALINERNSSANDTEAYRDYEKLLTSIILFLQEKYGKDTIARLMANVRGKDLEEAFVATYGKGSAGLEEEWKAFYGIK